MKLHSFRFRFEIMDDFHEWVANTIQELGGSGTQYLYELERECPLTYRGTTRGTRMDAWQGGGLVVYATHENDAFLASMPLYMIAPTNLAFLH